MTKIKFVFAALSMMFVGLLSAQTSSANFENEAVIWQESNGKFTSTFTVETSADGIATIKERYDDLKQSVSYQVVALGNEKYTITMSFGPDHHAAYLHKMLVYIGCQVVVVAGKKMTMDEFANYLFK
jgi:hypothetical protein